MAVVGRADIMVRAITTGVKKDIERGFNGLGGVGARSGRDLGNSLTRAFRSAVGQKSNGLTRLRDEIQQLYPEADRASENFTRLMRVGYVLQGAIGAVGGSIGALGGGLISLVGAAGGAAASLAALAPIMVSFGLAAVTARLALGGVGQALSEMSRGAGGAAKNTNAIEDAQRNLARVIESSNERITKANQRVERAQISLNKAFEEGREQMQQLNFDAEDAALAEQRAALELERARETLLRVQDLPPNSRARREAELAYAEADLNYRRAIDTNADLAKEQARLAAEGVEGTDAVIGAREELANAEEDLAATLRDTAREQEDAARALQRALEDVGSAGGGAYAKLNEAQQKFVDFLLSLKPLIDDLKESIANELLPDLQTAIQNIVDGAFPTFKRGLTEIADALGDAAITFSTAFQDPENILLLEEVFTNAATTIRKFGDFAKPALGVVLSLLTGIDPLAQRFLDWVIDSTEKFDAFLKTTEGQESMAYFFQESGDQASRFGTLIGNVFGGIKNIIYDSFKPGSGADVMLTYFEKVTESFKNADTVALNNNLRESAENAVKMFDALGDLFGVLMQIGAMDEVGQFWDALASGSAEFAYAMREAVKVAPAMGQLIATLTQIVAIFQDAGAGKAFFETLQNIAGGFQGILETLKPVLDFIGPFLGSLSAIGLALGLLGTSFLVVVGFVGKFAGGLGTLIGMFTGTTAAAAAMAAGNTGVAATAGAATTATVGLGTAMKAAFLTNPIGLAIMAIVTAGTALWALFEGIQQERLDKAVNSVTAELKGANDATQIWNKSLLAVADGASKDALKAGGMKEALKGLSEQTKTTSTNWRDYKVAQSAAFENAAAKEALGAIGESLADLATNDLAAAQDAFQNMATSQGLSNDELLTAIDNMPEFKDALVAQAEQYGVNVYTTDGLVDSQEVLNFAMETGQIEAIRLAEAAEEEARRHNAAMQEKMNKLADAALANSDYFNSLKDSYKDGEFNMDEYLKNTQDRLVEAQKLVAAKTKLIARGATDEMLAQVDALGENALDAAEEMLKLTDGEFKKLVDNTTNAGYLAGQGFAKMMADNEGFIATVTQKLGKTSADKLIEELSKAKNDEEFKRITTKWSGILSSMTPIITTRVNADTSAAETAISRLANRQIKVTMPDGSTGTISLTQYMKQYAQGGLVSGPGTGTSDSIMARLSNGEFVVNAAATSKYLPLLQQLNGGKYATSRGGYASGGMVSRGDGASMTVAPTVYMTINPSPGMDERLLATQVSKQLALQLRKGGIA